jgi:hypothetical protein
MSATFAIIFLVYVVTGTIPPVIAHYLIRVNFLGGTWSATIVGVIAAVMGGLAQALFLPGMPDLVVVAGAVDIVPPLLGSVLVTTIFGIVSSTNSGSGG